MFVYKYPNWVAEIVFKDGTYAVFDGPKDMFRYYFDIDKYSKNKTREDIAEIHVTDYYTTEHVKVEDVFFVTGSDVYGPMGEELVPVKGRKAAENFAADHNGKKIRAFDEVTPQDIPSFRLNK
jgi:nitrous oxide reductase accessory protein NosL